MSLADAIAEATPSLIGQRGCAVCDWLDTQDVDSREAVASWVKAGRNRTQLARMCQDEGLPAKLPTFLKHCRECVQ